MKQVLVKQLTAAALAVFFVPATLLAQQDKEKEKAKDKTERQQIIITRNGDKDEKTVVEIQGDKVKVNGKDVADLKDVQVHVNNLRTTNGFSYSLPGRNNYGTGWVDYGKAGSLYKLDSNRAMLGVVTDAADKGAEIQSITKGSAAEKAGLKKGDVITKIDSRKIDATDDVSDAVRAHKPGDKVTITFLRDDKEQKATAELGRWKGMTSVQAFGTSRGFQGFDNQGLQNQMNDLNQRLQGMSVAPRIRMNGEFFGNRPKLGLSVQDTDDGKGVKVLEADDDGNAAKAGIKEGDVITQIDDKAVNGADEISKLVKEKKDQSSLRLQILRNGKPQTVEVKMPRKLKTVDL